MAERNSEKDRLCNKCCQVLKTTAAGIKDHAAKCNGQQA